MKNIRLPCSMDVMDMFVFCEKNWGYFMGFGTVQTFLTLLFSKLVTGEFGNMLASHLFGKTLCFIWVALAFLVTEKAELITLPQRYRKVTGSNDESRRGLAERSDLFKISEGEIDDWPIHRDGFVGHNLPVSFIPRIIVVIGEFFFDKRPKLQ
ncbi:uncharacterized protein MONOS_7314 [Monocercomonoides exilis]|uniref:uncharacterized protein n=1 Tax=Monocercomonoides exilis TaxID=2049356 RepID=UPI00355A283F|nr:hypothetical protein MONOS_7314 [Monocercomonoides exilis]|eukprot:MONOS_7314.1-p1 / transcript=MONOS_7314.1 / gene=MONOS_7314 / organism=Monocercomonoides_exilis_PA203 / gene_product=unspecified product / transcript_product=unspecified product / location=Mono_scaffold00247:49004-49620(-) / protein_length=153 / sequence_SO=supercontig / SO=protein_coding / is_pseudo=false